MMTHEMVQGFQVFCTSCNAGLSHTAGHWEFLRQSKDYEHLPYIPDHQAAPLLPALLE